MQRCYVLICSAVVLRLMSGAAGLVGVSSAEGAYIVVQNTVSAVAGSVVLIGGGIAVAQGDSLHTRVASEAHEVFPRALGAESSQRQLIAARDYFKRLPAD